MNRIPDIGDVPRNLVVKKSTAANLKEKKDSEHPLEDGEFQERNGVPQNINIDSPKEDNESQENNSPTKLPKDDINNNEFEDEDGQLMKYTEEQLSKINENLLHMDISIISEIGNKKINTDILDEYEKKVCIKKKQIKCFSLFPSKYIINFVNYRQSSIMKRQLK